MNKLVVVFVIVIAGVSACATGPTATSHRFVDVRNDMSVPLVVRIVASTGVAEADYAAPAHATRLLPVASDQSKLIVFSATCEPLGGFGYVPGGHQFSEGGTIYATADLRMGYDPNGGVLAPAAEVTLVCAAVPNPSVPFLDDAP